jgi:hypothetical protein
MANLLKTTLMKCGLGGLIQVKLFDRAARIAVQVTEAATAPR